MGIFRPSTRSKQTPSNISALPTHPATLQEAIVFLLRANPLPPGGGGESRAGGSFPPSIPGLQFIPRESEQV